MAKNRRQFATLAGGQAVPSLPGRHRPRQRATRRRATSSQPGHWPPAPALTAGSSAPCATGSLPSRAGRPAERAAADQRRPASPRPSVPCKPQKTNCACWSAPTITARARSTPCGVDASILIAGAGLDRLPGRALQTAGNVRGRRRCGTCCRHAGHCRLGTAPPGCERSRQPRPVQRRPGQPRPRRHADKIDAAGRLCLAPAPPGPLPTAHAVRRGHQLCAHGHACLAARGRGRRP